MKIFKKLLLLATLPLLLGGCGNEMPKDDGKLPVTVSFTAMKKLTEEIGGDKVSISLMVPDGTEPHEFEPRTTDLIRLSRARVFIYNGMGMEHWADKAIQSADNKNLIVVEASKGVTPIPLTDEDEIREHGTCDPHTWLGLEEAKTEAKNIRDGLIEADPANQKTYETNYENFTQKADALKATYDNRFKNAPRKELVTGHAAFGYLARDFHLTQESVEDAFAIGEPPAKKLIALIQYCKEHHVKTIFTEETMDPALARTLATEAGANAETLSTMEEETDMSYLDAMKENLEKIEKALE